MEIRLVRQLHSNIFLKEKKYRFIAQGKAEVKLLKEIENKIYSENPELKL